MADNMYITDGWTWSRAIKSALMVLICNVAVELVSQFTIRIINWFLLRSFAVISREWCFVFPPHKRTKLERSQTYLKLACGVLALLMRWPGWRGCGVDLWQCVLHASICFMAVEFTLVFCLVFVEAFVRTGHYLALNLGWTPEPVPWWDYGLTDMDVGCGHGPAVVSSTPFPSEPLHQPYTDRATDCHQPMRVLYAGYGNRFRQSRMGSDMATRLRSSQLSNTAFPMTPSTAGDASLLRRSNTISHHYIPWSPDPQQVIDESFTAEQTGFSHTRPGEELSTTNINTPSNVIEFNLLGISTELRRRFT